MWGGHAAIRSLTRTRLSVDTRRHTHTGHGTNPRRRGDDMPQGLQQSHRAPHLPTHTHARAHTHTHTLPNLVLLTRTRTNETRPPPHLSHPPALRTGMSHTHRLPDPLAPALGPWGDCFLYFHPCAAPTSQETWLKFHLLQRLPNCNPAPLLQPAFPPRRRGLLHFLPGGPQCSQPSNPQGPPPPGERQPREDRGSVQA